MVQRRECTAALHGEGYIMRKDRDNGNGTIRTDEEGSERVRVEGDLQADIEASGKRKWDMADRRAVISWSAAVFSSDKEFTKRWREMEKVVDSRQDEEKTASSWRSSLSNGSENMSSGRGSGRRQGR